MGSEQSAPQNSATVQQSANSLHNFQHQRPNSGSSRLQRGNTIAAPGGTNQFIDGPSPLSDDSRPVSPPISVCSDSDLPYISYTDRPIGDSPKIRNKGPNVPRMTRANTNVPTKKQVPVKTKMRASAPAHNIVVVKAATTKDASVEKDPDIMRLQSIPMFLPVMRGSLSLPANRDPEVLERLQPIHLSNMCRRMQAHYNACANRVASDQAQLTFKVKEIDQEITRLLTVITERQKLLATYSEHFSKVRSISQQLSRCNSLLNLNIESMEQLNNLLDIEDRLEPFVWTTG